MIEEYPKRDLRATYEPVYAIRTYKKLHCTAVTVILAVGEQHPHQHITFLHTRIIRGARLAHLHKSGGGRHQLLTTQVFFAATGISLLLFGTWYLVREYIGLWKPPNQGTDNY